ncbi:Abnormal spindle-like microcephaly-associated protein-like protein [Bienertia sinuspersici]
MQNYWRRWLARKSFLHQKEAVIRIQNAFRVMMCRYAFHCYRHAATDIQRVVRGKISRNRLLGASSLRATASRQSILTLDQRLYSTELRIVLHSIVKLQRWWRRALEYRLKTEAAVAIQYYTRVFICRQKAMKERHQAVIIQAHWKGYLARKHAKEQLADLRLRIQKSAATVEDGMRIMNRLIAALKELKSMKNVSGILHNCATLNEGAIEILLYQITAVTRSIPDQEVLKHCLSTLRNLARYPHLADVLIHHRGSIETILRELLRNKEEGYFIACELLKKLCTRPKGIETVRGLPSMLKRFHALVDELTRKTNHEKRNHRGMAARDTTERRLNGAVELWNLITYGWNS